MNNNKYPHLTSPIQLGKVTFRNRIFSAPMGATDITADCCPGPRTQGFYELRAKGGAAAVTVSELVVHPEVGTGTAVQVRDVRAGRRPGASGQGRGGGDSTKHHRHAGVCGAGGRRCADSGCGFLAARPANITKAIYEAYHAALDI